MSFPLPPAPLLFLVGKVGGLPSSSTTIQLRIRNERESGRRQTLHCPSDHHFCRRLPSDRPKEEKAEAKGLERESLLCCSLLPTKEGETYLTVNNCLTLFTVRIYLFD